MASIYLFLTMVCLSFNVINAQIASPSTTAAPEITASVVVSIYLDEKYAERFGSYASVITANSDTTAYAFPALTADGYVAGFNYTQIGGPGQTWIYTSTKNIPVTLLATCSALPSSLISCGVDTYGENTAQGGGGFTLTLPFETASLHPITVTNGLEKLPKTSATPTSNTQSSSTSVGATGVRTSGSRMIHVHSFWILYSVVLMTARVII